MTHAHHSIVPVLMFPLVIIGAVALMGLIMLLVTNNKTAELLYEIENE